MENPLCHFHTKHYCVSSTVLCQQVSSPTDPDHFFQTLWFSEVLEGDGSNQIGWFASCKLFFLLSSNSVCTSSITSVPIYVCRPVLYSFKQHSFIYEILVRHLQVLDMTSAFMEKLDIRYRRRTQREKNKSKCTYFLYSIFLFFYSAFKK